MLYGMMQLQRKIKVEKFFKLPNKPDMKNLSTDESSTNESK
jgi:hypothetical protein